MNDRIVVASNIHGRMTDVRGRYELGDGVFEILSDGSVRSGGPGSEASSLDLLVASLVSCALNAFRQDFVEAGEPDRHVEIFARVERRLEGDYLGTLIMECFIDAIDPRGADELVLEYKKRCRIYNALKDSLPVVFVLHTPDSVIR
ncbi:OsmC family protein [Microbacterium ulmi]|uniref:OsmC family protein n=1 Tax=Microbacterium ulmi TaxID=179095 RepID=A0A7Y2M0Q9_9MICO|nr:OsmC family protein [Microbacterium ulmi]NII69304.1 putative OsmC-like protein [Microbacterium ulmi]NNH04082.1 OsmC family protein [Microbacterium ulmi]